MSMGGGRPKTPPPPPPPPTMVEPDIEEARRDMRDKIRRQRGRAASVRTTPGMLSVKAPQLSNAGLSDTLG
jgi:hypothetical protein